jgi:hypothetical protein
MKHVFNSNEVAHVWASQQQDEGRNSFGNFYFRNDTIFSYGSHFPIATMQSNDVLFTLRTYSNTTAKHIGEAYRAITHKNVIYCYDVPVKYSKDTDLKKSNFYSVEHENNFKRWKGNITSLFAEIGNKKNRKLEGKIMEVNRNIEQLEIYAKYFGIKIKDKELLSLIKIARSENFIESARKAKENENKATEIKLKKATKAHEKYIELWRKYDSEAIKNLDSKTKELCNYYQNNSEAFTRLRFNEAQNRLETSKGIQIPMEVAKRAYTTLNGCFMTNCKDLSIPVMNYEITESTKQYIKAGCHTIPNEDVKYIAQLLNW